MESSLHRDDQLPRDVIAVASNEGPTSGAVRADDHNGDAPQPAVAEKPGDRAAPVDGGRLAPVGEVSVSDAPSLQPAPAPSAKSFALMNELEALAQDFASHGRDPANTPDDPGVSASPSAAPTIRVPPRTSEDQFASERPSIGSRVAATVVRIFLVALMGAGIAVAGQYYGVWSAIVPTAGEITADKAVSPLPVAATEPSPQSAAAAVAPAMSPDLKKQLDALTQDLASVRDGLAALAAKQEQLATVQQLEQFAAAQQQIAAKQEQIAQTVAKLQASEATLRRKMTPPPTRAAVPAPPQAAPLPAPVEAQAAPASRATHPLPPLPVPAPPR